MQAPINCHSIRQSLVEYFTDNIIVEQTGEVCAVSLPISTIDGRFADVFIEQRADYFLVNDGGKAANELILQGVEITESISTKLGLLAKTFGVTWTDEMFQAAGKADKVQSLALAVGTCSALATVHLLGHGQIVEEEPMREQFGGILKKWTKPHRYKLRESVGVDGAKKKQHRFDFVAYPKKMRPIAFSILSPSVSAISAAERFAFKISDLATTPVIGWQTVAVEDRSEVWSKDASALVRKCADEIIEFRSDEPIDEQSVYERLDQLVIAA